MESPLVTLILSFLTFQLVCGQVVYPEHPETDKSKLNLSGRKPLFSPTHCGPHELLYPGDQETDWICDCAPATLYYPEKEACYPAFRQGPCENGEFLVLHLNKNIPECIVNECRIDGQVMINKVCYELGQSSPCRNAQLTYVLGVNPTTLLIDCVKLSISTRLSIVAEEVQHDSDKTLCANGTRRAIQGRCPSNN